MNNRKKTKKQYKIASLFSGCGGLDLGALGGFYFQEHFYERLATKIVFANERNNYVKNIAIPLEE